MTKNNEFEVELVEDSTLETLEEHITFLEKQIKDINNVRTNFSLKIDILDIKSTAKKYEVTITISILDIKNRCLITAGSANANINENFFLNYEGQDIKNRVLEVVQKRAINESIKNLKLLSSVFDSEENLENRELPQKIINQNIIYITKEQAQEFYNHFKNNPVHLRKELMKDAVKKFNEEKGLSIPNIYHLPKEYSSLFANFLKNNY